MTTPKTAEAPDQDHGEWLQVTLGERFKIRVPSAQTMGAYSMIEIVADSGNGAPLHIHNREEEHFIVLEWSDVRLRQCLATRFSWQPRRQCNDSRRTGIVFGIMVKAAISLMDPGLVANSMEKLRESMNSTRRISTPAR